MRGEAAQPDLDLVATAWTYAILIVPILLLPIALDRRDDAALWVAELPGAISAVLALIGFLRWVFVVRHWHRCIKRRCRQSNCVGRGMALQHQFGGALLGSIWTVSIGWSVTLASSCYAGCCRAGLGARTDRQRALPVQSGRHPGNGSPGFPVFDLTRGEHRLGPLVPPSVTLMVRPRGLTRSPSGKTWLAVCTPPPGSVIG